MNMWIFRGDCIIFFMFALFFSKNARNSTLFAQKDQKSGNRGRNFDLKTDYKQSLWFISDQFSFFT